MSDNDDRLEVEHIAANLYRERFADDTRAGKADVYARNPDSVALYFKGVYDVLLVLEEWVEIGVSNDMLCTFIEALQDQTRNVDRVS